MLLRLDKLCSLLRIRDPMPFWTLGPGSSIRNRSFPDPGSRIPNPYFWEVSDTFLGKKFYNSFNTGPNFVSLAFQNKIIFSFVKFVATKKDMTTNFFHPSLLLLFLDPGSGMGKIPYPQHCPCRGWTLLKQ
jgi:hypothetical protein